MAKNTNTEAKVEDITELNADEKNTQPSVQTGIKKNSIQDNIDRMNEMVTISLFKDSGRYKDDLFVRVDGKRYQVKRGIPVQVPRKVADVINQQLMQDQATAQLIEKKEAEYDKKSQVFE